MPSTSVVFEGPASPGLTLAPWRRGGGDPSNRISADGAVWRTSAMATGPVTARITKSAVDTVDCEAWGPGAVEFLDAFAALVGAEDDAGRCAPREPTSAGAPRGVATPRPSARAAGLRALGPGFPARTALRP
ncbi:DNA-3-methyladenine glycosylase 2 family protein, partial [Mycolicibacterium porcinum]